MSSDASLAPLIDVADLPGDAQRTRYLDHAGATVPLASVVRAAVQPSIDFVLGNPHSNSSPSAQRSATLVDDARRAVLRHFGATEAAYAVVFTSGATAALKLLAESIPWTQRAQFVHARSCHTSVLGMRQYALRGGAQVVSLPDDAMDEWLRVDDELPAPLADLRAPVGLLCYAPECNLSGIKSPRRWTGACRALPTSCPLGDAHGVGDDCARRDGLPMRWFVCWDAAKAAAASPVHLDALGDAASAPDFVAVSFYKMFGFPTGVGALLIRREAADAMPLRRPYFGGGTVEAASSVADYVVQRSSLHERFEDGTTAFSLIAGLLPGLALLERIGMPRLERHVFALAQLLHAELTALRHESSGQPVCVTYGRHAEHDVALQGGVVAFNLLRSDGSYVGYSEVDRLAALNGIHLRTGCLCNPGACHAFLDISAEQVRRNLEAGHVCWDDRDLIDGKPLGVVRASFGYSSERRDVEALVAFVRQYFVDGGSSAPAPLEESDQAAHVSALFVYPIKSCGGIAVDRWALGAEGLMFDRQWSIIGATGVALSQRRLPRMALLRPRFDMDANLMHLEFFGEGLDAAPTQSMSIDVAHVPRDIRSDLRVCTRRDSGHVYGDEVARFLTACLGVECNLLRSLNICTDLRAATGERRPTGTARRGSFSNEGSMLLVSQRSVAHLNARLVEDGAAPVPASQFRPNVVVDGLPVHAEDACTGFALRRRRDAVAGGVVLRRVKACGRCTMVNIDQARGCASSAGEPLRTLAGYRRTRGAIEFGVLVEGVDGEGEMVCVGDAVEARH